MESQPIIIELKLWSTIPHWPLCAALKSFGWITWYSDCKRNTLSTSLNVKCTVTGYGCCFGRYCCKGKVKHYCCSCSNNEILYCGTKILSLDCSTCLLSLGMADKVCLGSPSWGILLTWPNHLSCVIFKHQEVATLHLTDYEPQMHTYSSKIFLLNLRKILVSNACTRHCIFLSLPHFSLKIL